MLTLVCCGNKSFIVSLWYNLKQYIMKDLLRDKLEEQILLDATLGDTTVFADILSRLPDNVIYEALSDESQLAFNTYYEIHVCGDESFSTSIKCNYPLHSTEDVINLAIELDLLDCHDARCVDYVQELSYDEWNTHFNTN